LEIYHKLKEKETYKFKTVNDITKEIDQLLYSSCLKLQYYSKSPFVHKLCVGVFLNKGKALLAYKSLQFLSRQGQSYDYFESYIKFNEYLTKNESQINPEVLSLMKSLNLNDQDLKNSFCSSNYKSYLKDNSFFKGFENELRCKKLFNESIDFNKLVDFFKTIDLGLIRNYKIEVKK
jgi:hypothetical protein